MTKEELNSKRFLDCHNKGHNPRRWYQQDTLCQDCGIDMKEIDDVFCGKGCHIYKCWNGSFKRCIKCGKVIDWNWMKELVKYMLSKSIIIDSNVLEIIEKNWWSLFLEYQLNQSKYEDVYNEFRKENK